MIIGRLPVTTKTRHLKTTNRKRKTTCILFNQEMTVLDKVRGRVGMGQIERDGEQVGDADRRTAQLTVATVTGSSYIYVKFKSHRPLQVEQPHKQHALSPVTLWQPR